MNLVIDIGNTQTKCGIFYRGKLLTHFTLKKVTVKKLKHIFKQYPVKHSIVASVADKNKPVIDFLKANTAHVFFNHKTLLPVKNKYATPATLGLDRLANAVGAYNLFGGKNTLIVDAGTCIKFDLVNNKNEYLGGAISAGIQMRFKALNHYTDKLPLIKLQINPKLIGNSTQSSIASGVQNGALAEIEHIILRYKKQFKGLKIILTGGDAGLFVRMLKSNIFAAPHLTLLGLNEILTFNTASEK